MFYEVDFICNDEEELQHKLNYLYGYRENIGLKVKHRNRINLFFLLMEKLIKQNVIDSFDSAIDIGCNSGAYSKIISDFGFRYVLGIDIDESKIKKAYEFFAINENGKILEYKVMNAENIDSTKKYNFVLCAEVIEHTDNPKKVIENIKAVLTPGGVAIITLPNKISLPSILTLIYYKIIKNEITEAVEQHQNYPFYKAIRLFRDKRLRIIETSGSNLIFFRYTVNFFYNTPAFPIINKINFYFSKLWPFKYFSHSFFILIKNIDTNRF